MNLAIEVIKILFLSLVEGVTEWLPVSSTGHLILTEEFITLNQSTAWWEFFLIFIQLGAILAVVVLFFNKLNPFRLKKTQTAKTKRINLLAGIQFDQPTFILWLKVLVATIPAAIIGLLFDDFIEAKLLNPWVVSTALIIYGVVFVVIESGKRVKNNTTELADISFKTAFLVGLFQCLALVPGTSRSGSTIIGGMLLGLKRVAITEFTFFMAIPVMFGASLLKLVKTGLIFSTQEWLLLIFGFVMSFIFSVLAIKFLINYVKKHDFKAFGYYRIALGLIVLAYFLFK